LILTSNNSVKHNQYEEVLHCLNQGWTSHELIRQQRINAMNEMWQHQPLACINATCNYCEQW